MREQNIVEVLEQVRQREDWDLLRVRVWERSQRTWWDRHGDVVLWTVAIVLGAVTLWAVWP